MATYIQNFTSSLSLEKRKEMSSNAKDNNPGYIPVIIANAKNTPGISKNKLMIEGNSKFREFILSVKNLIPDLKPEQNIFFYFSGSSLIKNDQKLFDIYEKYKHQDGFLYVVYACENTFG